MLDESLEIAAAAGTGEVVLGMAHRGRLNVLAHTVGMPYEKILREFEGERTIEVIAADVEGGTGDVKYHLGARGTYETAAGEIGVTLAANPSHLEAVDPVVEGWTRAEQTDRAGGFGAPRPERVDADPPPRRRRLRRAGRGRGDAQPVRARGLLDRRHAAPDHEQPGRLHDRSRTGALDTPLLRPREGLRRADRPRQRRRPRGRALGRPPGARVSQRFGHDVVIDLVGYRRFGHNEQDEAAYTQPLMVEQINRHPTVRELYADRLIEAGVLTAEEAEALDAEAFDRLRQAHERLKASFGQDVPPKSRDEVVPARRRSSASRHAFRRRCSASSTRSSCASRPGSRCTRSSRASSSGGATALDEGGIDWGQAEALAFASLVVEGVPIRLTGQDTERGTFSHRHLVLHDARTGERCTPIQELEDASASFEVYNSPLSEFACVGFEYGYSAAAPETLVLWEAQFGDFANGAQTIIDQFISSGLAKWKQTSRLTMLLPHGYEGNGPEHSSARLERFLQLAAQENIRIANCTTAGAVLPPPPPPGPRRERAAARRDDAEGAAAAEGRRRRRSTSSPTAPSSRSSTTGRPGQGGRPPARPLLREDLLRHHERRGGRGRHEVAVARIEQLYPFPVDAAHELIASYPHLDEVVWAQEEPQNMGAWRTIRHRLEEAADGRAASASSAGRGARVRRGLPDRAPARARADRARRARAELAATASACGSSCTRTSRAAARAPSPGCRISLRWLGGMRRQSSHAVSAAPIVPVGPRRPGLAMPRLFPRGTRL